MPGEQPCVEEITYRDIERFWELAVMYRELKTRGLVKSAGDAVGRGVQLIYDEALERDMKRVRVSAAERLERGVGLVKRDEAD